MGSITDNFADLSEVLVADFHKITTSKPANPTQRVRACDLLVSRALRPLLPCAVRLGMGQVIDVKDRQTGPLDIVGCWEIYPPLGEGMAHAFLIDGVIFCLQVRNWAVEDLTQFAGMAGDLKKLERKTPTPIFCAAVGFEPLPVNQVLDFLKSAPGQSVDAVLSMGEHLTLRNSQGWFGDAQRVPFVTERGAGHALKAFAFLLAQISQTFLGMPFHLGDYQHL